MAKTRSGFYDGHFQFLQWWTTAYQRCRAISARRWMGHTLAGDRPQRMKLAGRLRDEVLNPS
jgi:hypothetical protein